MRDKTTCYQRNREKLLNWATEYYENNNLKINVENYQTKEI